MMDKRAELHRILAGHQKIAVAFSGGTDSALLLAEACNVLQGRVLALTARTEFTPSGELERAGRIAQSIGARHIVVPICALADPRIKSNSPDRCYYCKRSIFTELKTIAAANGYDILADGTNADDERAVRPGRRAALELGVVSPLLEAGMTKPDIRELSAQLGLESAQIPSNSCLATRVPAGTELDESKLRMIDTAELMLIEHGFYGVRARTHGDVVRLEVLPHQLEQVFKKRSEIAGMMRDAGFARSALDLEGYANE